MKRDELTGMRGLDLCMKLAWATDLHLNFCAPAVRSALYDEIRATGADALLVTGDVAAASSVESLLLELAAAVAMPVFFVLGNHDFYGGSVRAVRDRARALADADTRLCWLPAAGVVALGGGTALVGHDGWADGRLGDWWHSSIVLNDYLQIEELAAARLDRTELLARIQALAAEAAGHFAAAVPRALADSSQVVVATHVPPFRDACWHEGRISDDQWLPHFSSRIAGEALLAAAAARPASSVTVLCGHTHGEGVATLLPNLTVYTGGAEYGQPRVQRVLSLGEG